MKYTKFPLTIDEQVELFISRGLSVPDRDLAVSILKQISYYRLSAYGIPFQIEKDRFQDGATFDDVLRLYRFDHALRMLVFDRLEKVEVTIRTRMTYFLAHKFGAFGYLDENNYCKQFKGKAFNRWVKDIEKEVD